MKNQFKKIKTLAVANRGEVAVRIIRACQEMGIETVLLHSECDTRSRAYRIADRRICIGPSPTAESYLSIEKNIEGALSAGADGVHPGFGFLSENAIFAEECARAGLQFVGPSPNAIKILGDKVRCKEIALKLGVPLVPGYQGAQQEVKALVEEGDRIGYPVIVKAAAGGGGRGMKVIHKKSEAKDLIESAQREAMAAFGSSTVFLEKYLDRAKHIEFQIFAEASGEVRHLFERECSVQRRHQKIIEEAPSPSLTEELRMEMALAATTLVQNTGYLGAGTVEFLLQDNKFYFMEVNTRLQVEHPVTEMILGVDLVKAQILAAQGLPSGFKDRELRVRGHSLECRLYAEDPHQGGVPSTGVLGLNLWPEAFGRRFEYGFEEGDEITPFYDSMIAKVIVWDENRVRAIEKMDRVLRDTVIFGVSTNIPLLLRMINHLEFTNGVMTTQFFETHFGGPFLRVETPSVVDFVLQNIKNKLGTSSMTGESSKEQEAYSAENPWATYWRGV